MAKTMNSKLCLLLLIMLFQIAWPGVTVSETTSMSEDELEEFIKKVIRENPQLIYDTVNEHIITMRKVKAEKKISDQELGTMLSQRVEDTVHPHNPVMGRENAPVTIIAYSDFNCHYCAKGDEMVRMLMDKYPDKLRFIFKNNPNQDNEQPNEAALAAMAAHKQGRFWEYHDLLFQASPDVNEKTMLLCAEMMMLNMEQFNKDRKSDEIRGWVKKDKADAKKLNLVKTPTFVINGVLVRGVLNEKNFASIIERLISEIKRLEKKSGVK
ncbi:thioredoxin domain-containing protein [Desulfobacterales bacterium HSG16]|nr:thioredoxin domain-containing protein [Desulfobacterales bacterium HSG16]